MKISTKWTSNSHGASQIIARFNGKQKTTPVDLSKSNDWNHGTAAANVIIHVSNSMHPLTQQNGDYLPSAVIRSLDAGYGTHDQSDDGQRHTFEV